MRRPLIVLLAVAACAAAAPAARAAEPVKVQLLAFNDFHGHL